MMDASAGKKVHPSGNSTTALSQDITMDLLYRLVQYVIYTDVYGRSVVGLYTDAYIIM